MHAELEWIAQASNNLAGGLLCIWDPNAFQLNQSFQRAGFMSVVGEWKEKGVGANSHCECVLLLGIASQKANVGGTHST